VRLLVLGSLIVMGGCAANPGPSQVPFGLPPGFKPTRISGELFFCRKMVVLGSRFPRHLCLSEDQLKEYLARTEEMKRNKEEASHVCTTSAGCGMQ
jgi:hypothetical protein